MAANPEQARIINRSLILTELSSGRSLSRVEIAKKLKLSKMTISVIVSHLLEEGLIVEVGEGEAASNGGRKPILLSLSPRKYIVGFDIGESTTFAAASDLQGNVIDEKSVPTSKNKSPEFIANQTKELFDSFVSSNKMDTASILGVGVSAAGLVEKNRGVILFSPDFGWKNLDLQRRLSSELEQRVIIDNCTRVMALGERWYGCARDSVNLLFINVGYGVGSALMIGGAIYDNNSEFGHIRVTGKDIRCHCGKKGCLEAVASGHAIEKAAFEAKGASGEWESAKSLAEKARSGESGAAALFQDAGRYLGRSISMAVNLFNPDKVVIGGGVSLASDLLMPSLIEEYRENTMDVIRDSTVLEISALGQKAAVRGALALALDRFLV